MLQVASDDIINNTGITLANPTGVAGTYALAFSIQNLGVSMIASGGTHTMVITSDGQLRGWGSNSRKEVNPASANSTWTDITYTILENVKQVACGNQFTMALLSNGELRGWGNNASRQCNPGASTSPWTDINHTILSGVKSVACCENHTVVLMEDGTVRGWGANSSRESYPASATNPWTDSSATIISGAAEVSAGNEHTIILMEDGTVHGWGKNTDNQVNPNVNWLYNQIWTDVEEVILSGAKQVSSGSSHSGALLSNGNLLMWGSNGYKQCNPISSDARYTNIADPILVNVGQVSCGEANTHALLMNGNVVGWGLNNTKAAYPASATSPWTDNTAVIISGIESLSVGRVRFALFSDGSVRGWGGNGNRQCNPASATNPWTDLSTEIFNTSLIPAKLSWGGGTAQSVTEDGVYTLSDGSNNQTLILNFDGAEGATTYINDVTGEAIEPPYQEGCSIDTSWKKFGAGSLKVTAGSTLSLVLPSSNAGDITLHGVLKVVQELSVGNSPFCIELFSELTGDFLAFLRFNFDTDGPLGGGAICYFSYYDSANETYHDSDYFKGLAVGSESHIAMVIDGATVRGFVDGTNVWEYTHTGLITEFSMFDLWLVDGGQVNIDAVEITHEALWAENFTPPTSAPSAESGNTIEATVDYSALSAEDEADNVRVFEELLSISVNPPSKYIRPGDALQYSVIGNYELGVTRDITSQVTDWESSDTSIATMLSSGIAKAVATGKTTIKAVLGALSDTVLLMVRSVLPRPPQIVAFSSQKAYRSAEYLTKRFKFPKTSLSLVKVIASAYPVELDVVYPKLSKTLTVVVTSKRPKRIKSFLVDCCEVRIRTNSQVSAVFLASSMDELPL